MRFWIYITAAIVSIFMWVASYQAATAGYRLVESAGLMPNLSIETALTSLFG